MAMKMHNKPAGAGPAPTQVTLRRAEVDPTPDQALWVVIRNSADALSFANYAAFIEPIMSGGLPPRAHGHFYRINRTTQLTFPDAEPYRLLKVATEVFMMASCGVVMDEISDGPAAGTIASTDLEHADFVGPLARDPNFAGEEQLRLLGQYRAASLQQEWGGYLETTPPPDKPRLVGADASHAWLAVYCPGVGWIDVDPTNNVLPSDTHVTLAWGRDYGDVSPIRGVILGGGGHSLRVNVQVTRLEKAT